jgi:hypothetical protein
MRDIFRTTTGPMRKERKNWRKRRRARRGKSKWTTNNTNSTKSKRNQTKTITNNQLMNSIPQKRTPNLPSPHKQSNYPHSQPRTTRMTWTLSRSSARPK